MRTHEWVFNASGSRQGCCILDKVLGMMQLRYAVGVCPELHPMPLMPRRKLGGQKMPPPWASWTDAVGGLTPCGAGPGMGALLARGLGSCCDGPAAGGGGGGKGAHEGACSAGLRPVQSALVSALDAHALPACATAKHATAAAAAVVAGGSAQDKPACDRAAALLLKLIRTALRVARGLYGAEPLAGQDVTPLAKQVLAVCAANASLVQCNKDVERYTAARFALGLPKWILDSY